MKPIRNTIYLWGFMLCFLLILPAKAQTTEVNDSIKKLYKFIRTERNRLEGDTASLISFFEKLTKLKQDNNSKVVVVHLGDSHLQADHFPGVLRVKFQKEFGNAGRGLLAPFKVGRTNEPSSFKSSSNTQWHSRRIVNEKDNLPIGISGLSIENWDSKSFLKITTFNQDGLDYQFSKLSLFHQKGMKSFDLNLSDSASHIEAKINAHDDTLNDCSVAHVKPSNTIMFTMDEKDTNSGNSALIYGLLLENEQAGILFNMIGINGAEYRHYLKNPKFQTQVSSLQPDLFIISLGTNEAYAPHFSSVDFYKQVDSLVSILKAKNPNVVFILTTPGDSNKRVKYKNPNNAKAGKTLIEYCQTHGMVYWNWYQIMGGYGVINKWSAKGLTSKDKLHLSRKGYEVQGTLLHAAIMNAYLHYKQTLTH